jgi:cytidine deaminase
VDGAGAVLVPCGRCRQLLYEFGGPELVLETPEGLRTLDEMLPQAFGPQNLG